MADEPIPAGTDAPPATDTPAGATDAGAGASGSEEGDKKVTISSHEYVTLKASREQAKRDAEELERLREAVVTRTTTTDNRADDDTPISMTPAERAAYKAELRAAFKAGNRDAGALLAGMEASEEATASHRSLVYQLEMEKIPEDKRDAVKKHMKETGAPSPSIAYRLMRGGRDYETQAAEIERLKTELADARKPRSKPENTRIVGSPAGADDDGVPLKTLDEYNAMMRTDPHKTIADRKAGKFKLKA